MPRRLLLPLLGALVLVLACRKTPSEPADQNPTLGITTSVLGAGAKTVGYTASLTATGGDGVFTWSVSSGALPDGLALSDAGVISGTPTSVETADFTAMVSSGDGQSDTQALTLDINDNVEPGWVLAESSGGTEVSEAGATDDFTVALAAQPIRDVVVNVSSSDPGEVTVSPSSLTYTNTSWATPQTVTVTGVDDVDLDGDQASDVTLSIDDAASDDYFDTLFDEAIEVTTTDDDAVIRPVVRWTDPVDGVWSDASKWTPVGVPTATDSVAIDRSGSYTVTLDQNAAVAWLSVGAPTGTQVLSQVTPVTLTIDSAGLIGANGRYDLMAGMLNGGTVTSLGTVRKGVGADTSFVFAQFANDGLVEVLDGVLEIETEGDHGGDFEIGAGAVLRFDEAGDSDIQGSVTGLGVFEFDSTDDNDNLLILGPVDLSGIRTLFGRVNIDNTSYEVTDSIRMNIGDVFTRWPATKQIRYFFMETQFASWSGRTTWEVTDSLYLQDGAVGGQAPIRTLPGVPAVITGPSFFGDLELQGPSVWTGGQVNMSGSAQWEVLAGGSLEIQGNSIIRQSQAGTSQLRIRPGATLTKTTPFATTLERPLLVEGDFSFEVGWFTLEHDFTVAAGGTLEANGTFHTIGAGTITLDGTTSPGDSVGVLSVIGDWPLGPGTTRFDLGGVADSIGYDRLSVTDTVRLGGDMVVDAIGGFVPSVGQSFGVMTFEGRTGAFSSVSFPTIPGLTFDTVWAEAGTVDTLFIVIGPGPQDD